MKTEIGITNSRGEMCIKLCCHKAFYYLKRYCVRKKKKEKKDKKKLYTRSIILVFYVRDIYIQSERVSV